MASANHQFRDNLQREAVGPASKVVEEAKKLARECTRLQTMARSILDGASGSVDSEIASDLAAARDALEKAQSKVEAAGRLAGTFARTLQ